MKCARLFASCSGSALKSLPQGQYIPHLLFNKTASPTESEASVQAIVRQLVPHAKNVKTADMKVSPVGGGITNMLFKVSFTTGDPVLVRVFGAEGLCESVRVRAWMSVHACNL